MAENSLTFDNLLAVLREYGEEAARLYKSKIQEGRPPYGSKSASGELLRSVQWQVNQNGQTFEVSLSLAEYWKYVEGGAKGKETSPFGAVYPAHFPPPKAILDWIDIKPVIPTPDKRGRIPSKKSLAFLIGRAINRHGIEPFPALTNTVQELNIKYSARIAEAVTKDVAAFMPIIFSSFNYRDLANSTK